MTMAQWLGVGIFVLTYGFIITERMHRLKAVFLGFSLVLIFHIIRQEEIFTYIDFNTIGLLLGMMILVGIVMKTGLIEYIASEAVRYSKGDAWVLLLFLSGLTAVTSAFIDNVTTILLIGPIAMAVADVLEISPMPFLYAEIFSSNIGGTATLIGDPPNLLIGSAAGLTFNEFLLNLGPPVILSMGALFALLYIWYGKKLRKPSEEKWSFREPKKPADKSLTLRVLLHGRLHLEAATVALAGATLGLIVCPVDVEDVLHHVDWVTILFFSTLFMLVGTLEHLGVIHMLAEAMFSVVGDHVRILSMLLIWASGGISAVIDNVPYTAAVIPLVREMAQIGGFDATPLWWSLALGACFGGNGTLVGASANLVMAGIAGKAGVSINFRKFLGRGITVTAVTLAVSTVYVYIRYLI